MMGFTLPLIRRLNEILRRSQGTLNGDQWDREENPQMVPISNTSTTSFQPDSPSGESKNLHPDSTHRRIMRTGRRFVPPTTRLFSIAHHLCGRGYGALVAYSRPHHHPRRRGTHSRRGAVLPGA